MQMAQSIMNLFGALSYSLHLTDKGIVLKQHRRGIRCQLHDRRQKQLRATKPPQGGPQIRCSESPR